MKLGRRGKLGLLVTLAALALVASGCLRTSQVFTIYPDGSGKADISITLMGMMAQAMKMGQMGGMPDGDEMESPTDMVKQALQGKVYWTNLEAKDGAADTYVLTGTAYFEDVNEIQLENGGISFEKDEDGYRVSIQQQADLPGGMPGLDGGSGHMTPEEQAQAEQMKAMMRSMLAGFEMRVRVHMPGEVTSIEGFTEKDGRTATLRIGEKDILAMMDEDKSPPESMVVTSGSAADDLQAEWDAFKEELKAAKAASKAEGDEDEDEQADF